VEVEPDPHVAERLEQEVGDDGEKGEKGEEVPGVDYMSLFRP
jgi:hypothetical protein